ncbi:phosphoribosyl-ATP diphosphatase [Flexibacterium corallicola]|uniref:phosphoribosyl-ATP diphosphatase n=1 Tax=Flexibacterium corallicola TaxID=3037259 RepID=UPI00286EBB3A|nr:phosphoribosyl-ATP diphosphatase [Pseudovibrio sp. M1P-2-3]
MTNFTLEDLEAIVSERAASTDNKSYTRQLMERGVSKCAQKVGEEAVEAAIAAVNGDKQELIGESADLLYHLLVLLKCSDVSLREVMDTLASRTGMTGLEEKASRAEI